MKRAEELIRKGRQYEEDDMKELIPATVKCTCDLCGETESFPVPLSSRGRWLDMPLWVNHSNVDKLLCPACHETARKMIKAFDFAEHKTEKT